MQIEVRIQVLTTDRELRAWLVDELALISPTIEVRTTETLDGAGADLLIVGLDGLPAADIERMRELTIPVIAIGATSAQLASSVCLLDPTLTSKQLNRAVRDSLATPLAAARSLQPA